MSVAQERRVLVKLRPAAFPDLSFASRMEYAMAGGRDLRLDMLRGFCVFAMIVNHIGGESWLYSITGGNQFVASAAEGFVFISGLVLGTVSLRRVQAEGVGGALWAIVQRARVLYLLSIVLTLGFAAYVDALAIPWGWQMGGVDLPEAVIGTLTLHRTFYLIDILVLYTLLLGLVSPLALLLITRGHSGALLLGSWFLWITFQIYPNQANVPWPIEGGDAFPLASWQVLFVTGLLAGYHRATLAYRLGRVPRKPALIILGTLFVGMLWLNEWRVSSVEEFAASDRATWLLQGAFDKASLGPGRVISFAIVLMLTYLIATLFWRPIEACLGRFLLPLGQNALYAYTLQIVVVWVFLSGRLELLGHNPDIPGVNSVFQLAAACLIWLSIRRRFLLGIIPR